MGFHDEKNPPLSQVSRKPTLPIWPSVFAHGDHIVLLKSNSSVEFFPCRTLVKNLPIGSSVRWNPSSPFAIATLDGWVYESSLNVQQRCPGVYMGIQEKYHQSSPMKLLTTLLKNGALVGGFWPTHLKKICERQKRIMKPQVIRDEHAQKIIELPPTSYHTFWPNDISLVIQIPNEKVFRHRKPTC